MPERKRILVLAATASKTSRLREAADKLALELVLGCADETGALRLNFATRDSALHIVEFVQQNPVAAIIPVGDETAPSAARAASIVGLPFHPPKAADACANKELLRRKLEAAGVVAPDSSPAGPAAVGTSSSADLTIECVMAGGKLRVLAVGDGDRPTTFSALASDIQKNVPELLRKIIAALGLKHGPVRVTASAQAGLLAAVDIGLCYSQTALTDALRFRIPLVDQDISYEEVVIRNALDLDISRIHIEGK